MSGTSTRKDNKGRVLRKGESQRKSDLRYIYQYIDPNKKRRVIYANDLPALYSNKTEPEGKYKGELHIYV